MSGTEPLLDLLNARSGIVCAVGAGGKKTLLERLAAQHPGRVALTATVVTPGFPTGLEFDLAVAAEPALAAAVAALDASRGAAYACRIDKPGRHGGVSPALIERLHRELGFAATYVKADGARMRWIKAPAADEPVLPAGCTQVVGLVSARAIGQPLGPRVAHRLELLQEITGLAAGQPILPLHVGRLLASPLWHGKGAATAPLVPLINMVDDRRLETLAREAAETALALEPAIDRVVLACLQRAAEPVVAVLRR